MKTLSRRINKLFALVIISCLLITATGPIIGSAENVKIALITMDYIDQYWVTMNEGAQRAASELGVTVTFMSPMYKDDAQQIEKILDAVVGGYQAIVIAANGPDAVSSGIEVAKAARVKIVYVDSAANVPAEATYSTNNEAAGKTAGEQMLAALTAAGLTTGKIGIVDVNASTDSVVQRNRGFCQVFYGTGFTVLETQFCDGDASKAQTIAENYITQGVVGIFGTNEGSTVGLGNAIKATGTNKIIGVGFDKSDAIFQLIDEGWLLCSVAQDPYRMGYEGVKAAMAAIGGQQLYGSVVDTGVAVFMSSETKPAAAATENISGHWAASSIIFLRQWGFIHGDSNGNINPDNNITRAEFTAIINRIFKFNGRSGSNFPDVKYGSWYYDDFLIAKYEGYMLGDISGNANPGKPITRAEVSAILTRVLDIKAKSATSLFTDSDSFPGWSVGSIIAMTENGYINGYPDNTFKAANNITRAEAFTILAKVFYQTLSFETEEEFNFNSKIRIALITMDSIDQYWVTLNSGAQRAAEELGVEVIFMSPASKDDADQIKKINDAVAYRCHAIVIAANGPDAVSGALYAASNAGIKIVYVDSPANVPAEATFLTNNEAVGKKAGEQMLAALTAAGISTGKIGIVDVNASTDSVVQRNWGFRQAFAGTGFTVLETQYCDGDAAKAQNIGENYITQGVVGMFGTNEGSTVGLGNSIKASGWKSIIGVGFDKSDTILQLINDGWLLCSVAQDPYRMGYEGVSAAVAAIGGQQLGGAVFDTGIMIISRG